MAVWTKYNCTRTQSGTDYTYTKGSQVDYVYADENEHPDAINGYTYVTTTSDFTVMRHTNTYYAYILSPNLTMWYKCECLEKDWVKYRETDWVITEPERALSADENITGYVSYVVRNMTGDKFGYALTGDKITLSKNNCGTVYVLGDNNTTLKRVEVSTSFTVRTFTRTVETSVATSTNPYYLAGELLGTVVTSGTARPDASNGYSHVQTKWDYVVMSKSGVNYMYYKVEIVDSGVAYIGVNGVAKRLSKLYLGDGTARKVKKAYIGGSDGKARLWWSRDMHVHSYLYDNDYIIYDSNGVADNKKHKCARTCAICGKEVWETYNHTAMSGTTIIEKEATCTSTGKQTQECTWCHLRYSSTIAKKSHSYTSKVVTAATCYAEGLRRYTCSACGNSYDEVIAKKPHEWDTECGLAYCAWCGTAMYLPHEYQTYSVAPTCTTGGYSYDACIHCGETLVGSYVAGASALGHQRPADAAVCQRAKCTRCSTWLDATADHIYKNLSDTCVVCGQNKYEA